MAEKLQVLVDHYLTEFVEGNENAQADFVADIEGWARVHGLVMGNGQPTPITLVPHPIRKSVFTQALESAPLFNKLVHGISFDPAFIKSSLQHVGDPFTHQLLKILDTVHSEGIRQPIAMGIHRSDYMIHQGEKLQQVEINTISSAFGALTNQMALFHTHLIHQWGAIKGGKAHTGHLDKELTGRAALPNSALDKIVSLFGQAVYAYATSRQLNTETRATLCVLMIVQPGERNSTDQRWIQYALEEKHQIRTLRHSLAYVEENGTLDKDTGVLILNGFEVAVAYFRAGYTPTDYPTEKEWEARLKIERSLAIKCPNIGYHLAGTKKIQQILSLPGQVELFLRNPTDAKAVRECFAGMYGLEQDEANNVQTVIQKAIENPRRYVMKPQREGGGNLLANEDMVKALKNMSHEERADYILMERIEPEAHRTVLFRDGTAKPAACISELGVYCLMLASGSDNEIVNTEGGWLLRSKPEDVEDGGVAAGRAYLDSPFLF